MSACRLVLVLIACSTWLNWTSCEVNWLVSSGAVGSWFWSCVVSSVRNVLKLLPSKSDVAGRPEFAALFAVFAVEGVEPTPVVIVVTPS